MNKNPLCKCGCSERVSKPQNKYIVGHNSNKKLKEVKEKKGKYVV